MDFLPSDRLTSRLNRHAGQSATSFSQPIPVYVAIKRRERRKQFLRCAFHGFHDPETARNGPHIWTSDAAGVTCCFPESTKLQYVWLEINSTAPHGATVDVCVDSEVVVRQKRVRGRSTIRIRLPSAQVVTRMSLTIKSTTFVPSDAIAGSDDGRELGVAVRAIIFGKRRTKYGAGTHGQETINRRVARVVQHWWRGKAA